MEKETLADTIMETLKEKLNSMADSNKGWNKKIQVCFSDINVAYLVQIGEDGTVSQYDKKPLGEAEPADVAVHTTVDVLDSVMKRETNAMMAVMQGKIRIDGDMSVLTKLASAFM